VLISRTKSPFFRKSGATIANLRNAARNLARCVTRPLFLTKNGVVFVARRAQEGSSWTRPGPTLLRHAQKGLHLSTLCFTFQQAPVLGWSMARPLVGLARVEVQNMAVKKKRKAAAKRKPATKRKAKKAVAKKAPAKRKKRKSAKKAVAKKAPAKRKRRKAKKAVAKKAPAKRKRRKSAKKATAKKAPAKRKRRKAAKKK
jgi:hypothetical protein